jgi:hypothetical protein
MVRMSIGVSKPNPRDGIPAGARPGTITRGIEGEPRARAAAALLILLLLATPARAQRALDYPVVSRASGCVTPLGPDDLQGYANEQEVSLGLAPLLEGGRGGLGAFGLYGFGYYRRRSVWIEVSGSEDGRLAPDPGEPPARLTVGWERPVQYDAVHKSGNFGAGLRAGGGLDDRGRREVEAMADLALVPDLNLLGWLKLEFWPAWVARLRVRKPDTGDAVVSPSLGIASWRWPAFANDLALTYSFKADLAPDHLPVSSAIWQVAYTPGADRNETGRFLSMHAAYEHPWDDRARSRFSLGVSWVFDRSYELPAHGGK